MGVTVKQRKRRGIRSWFIIASCIPEFHEHTTSLDMPTPMHAKRLAKLRRLFRSHSDQDIKKATTKSARASSESSSNGVPRRRLLRVVRNEACDGGSEDVNPYVVRKYSQEFLEQEYLKKSQSIDETVLSEEERPLPYTVTGHTILKKYPSVDSGEQPTSQPRHTCFKEEVEVVEFDQKGRCSPVFKELLNDDETTSSACSVETGEALQQDDDDDDSGAVDCDTELPHLKLKADATLAEAEAPTQANFQA